MYGDLFTTDRLEDPDVSLPLEPGRLLCFDSERDEGFGDIEAGGTGDRSPVRRGGGGSILQAEVITRD